MIQALLCDFDGTIVNTLWLYPKAYRVALENFGFNLSDEEIIASCFGTTEEDICVKLGISDKVSEFKSLYFAAANTFSQEAKLFPDVTVVLHALKQRNVKLAIVSFAYRWYLERMLPALGLQDIFDIVIGFEDVAYPKPAPDAVIKAAQTFSLMSSQMVVIGDSKNDILMAKGAGARSILFYPQESEKFYDKNTLLRSKPDYIISHWRDLEAYI